jgi:hypothetical protein
MVVSLAVHSSPNAAFYRVGRNYPFIVIDMWGQDSTGIPPDVPAEFDG